MSGAGSDPNRGASKAADLLVIGGGLGAVAAALAALRRGLSVIVTEETTWLGGQLTSQATPPDEHPWIEQFGSTASYRELRTRIRQYYRDWYPLAPAARRDPYLNPGLGKVSKLCHEPRVAATVIESMLAPYVAAGRLTIHYRTVAVAAESKNGVVSRVTCRREDGGLVELAGSWVLDATELGDLLPLANIEYVTGFESTSETGEPSAPAVARPDDIQAFSWVFAIAHDGETNHTIARPDEYEHWSTVRPSFWPGPLLGLTAPDPRTLEPLERRFTPNGPSDPDEVPDQSKDPGDRELWEFRRILARDSFERGFLDSDVTVVNWPMIDYLEGSIIDVSPEERARHLASSRQLSLSMLYWLQTEAPRPDGGRGWPGLHLRGDVLGTEDGFSMAPYIRESRRIRSMHTIVEQDISLAARDGGRAAKFADTVGIGMYRIDLHPSTGGDNYIDVPSAPFQIPLGALIPRTGGNVLAASKNIGTTHITNGCYRLHPVEWNVGEAAGALAAFCLGNGITAADVQSQPRVLDDFQQGLVADGFELAWPEVKGY